MKKARYWIVFIFMVLVSMDSLAFTEDHPMFFRDYPLLRHQPLRGLQGLEVFVKFDNKPDGLTPSQVHKDTEGKIRKAGIKVLSSREINTALGRPCLYVQVDILTDVQYATFYRRYTPYYIFNIEVMLVEEVSLVRVPNIRTGAATWRNSVTGATPFLKEIRTAIKETVDGFIIEYQSANPK